MRRIVSGPGRDSTFVLRFPWSGNGRLLKLPMEMTPRPAWNSDLLIQLFLGVFVCLSLGVILSQALLSPGVRGTTEGRFLSFLTQTAVLHIGTILCVRHFLRRHRTTWAEGFGFARAGAGRAVGLGVGVALLATPLAMLLQQLAAQLMMSADVQPRAQEVVRTLEQTVRWEQQIYFALVALILAPAIEEFLFRGILYPAIKQHGFPRLALWSSALLFSLSHANVMTFLPLTFLALVLTWLYERTGNLLAPMVTHAMFNAINFILVIYQHELIGKLRAWQ